MSYSVLILTYNDESGSPHIPHIKWLILSNPEADIHIISENNIDKKLSWRNGDRKLREWWRLNYNRVTNSIIYVIEYDVLVTRKLPILSLNYDFVGRDVKYENLDPKWSWFREKDRLQLKETENIVGIAPFGFLAMRREVLDRLCDKKWDEIYRKDIFCEIRLSTVTSLNGFKIGEIDLPNVSWYETKNYDLTILGYYHPIKYPLNSSQSRVILSKLEKYGKYIINKYE